MSLNRRVDTCVPSAYDTTLMYLDALGIIERKVIEDFGDQGQYALVIEAHENPKVDVGIVFVFDPDGSLLSIS